MLVLPSELFLRMAARLQILAWRWGNGIFGANPIAEGEKRNRVVIVFSDGVPGWSGYDSNTANSAITQAETAKNTYGATVYSIGIFPGADATSAGNQNGNETEKANWFMQQVSSNNGTPQSPSYYLSAADAGTLNSIFQQISDQIETGGTTSTLTSDAVVKDIISPQFTLPAGTTAANITVETYACTGKNANDDYTWSNNNSTMGATASISGDQVNVTGFNFSENYVGTGDREWQYDLSRPQAGHQLQGTAQGGLPGRQRSVHQHQCRYL